MRKKLKPLPAPGVLNRHQLVLWCAVEECPFHLVPADFKARHEKQCREKARAAGWKIGIGRAWYPQHRKGAEVDQDVPGTDAGGVPTPGEQEETAAGNAFDWNTNMTDTELLDWLQQQAVDVIYLDGGRVIDVHGGSVRDAIEQAVRRGCAGSVATGPGAETLAGAGSITLAMLDLDLRSFHCFTTGEAEPLVRGSRPEPLDMKPEDSCLRILEFRSPERICHFGRVSFSRTVRALVRAGVSMETVFESNLWTTAPAEWRQRCMGKLEIDGVI